MKNRNIKGLLSLVLMGVLVLGGCNTTGSESSGNNTGDNTGGDDTPSGVLNTADCGDVADFNIYFYMDSADFPDSYDWLWIWNDDESYALECYNDTVVIEDISEDISFVQIHINFGQAYTAYSDWDKTASTTMTMTDQTQFTSVIFRSEDGSSQTKDISIATSMITTDDDGNYSIYIDGDQKQCYYSAADFPVSTIKVAEYGEALTVTGGEVGWIDLSGSNMENVFAEFSENSIQIRRYIYNPTSGTKRYYSDDFDIDYDACERYSDTSARVYFTDAADITYKYEVWCLDPDTGSTAYACDISFTDYYSSAAFDRKYYTDTELGAIANDDGSTTFRVWAPSARNVSVQIWEGSDSDSYRTRLLSKGDNGVWSTTLEDIGHGTYYTYVVNNGGIPTSGISDPYGLSSNANGKKSMVVDWDQVTEPSGYENYQDWAPDYENFSGVTIMEMHTRDFSADETWDGKEANRGKFKGLYESGTSYGGNATGFDYVKELAAAGLTHVQIMPAFDYSSVDETRLDDEDYKNAAVNGIYNWGYDPQQYNVPEGSYSSDPDDGETRVEEFMGFVNAYNNIGVGVVMDVVYNHMPGQSGTSFESVFPGYYFRDVTVSGAGVDIASQRSMVRQFIVDSVSMWAERYHISGFRFDLMGILDIKTMKAVRQALDEINPDILCYGEGWQMFNDDTDPSTGLGAADMAYQWSLQYMGEDWVGSFNDDVRDAIKGQQSGDESWVVYDTGYAQNALLGYEENMAYQKSKIYYGLTGTLGYNIDGRPQYTPSASDGVGASIMYTECHDNLTLWDKLTMSTPEDKRYEVEDMARMANSTVLSALSPSFFEIGQDFGRSKAFTDTKFMTNSDYFKDPYSTADIYYSHNSYNLSDEVNAVDWSLLEEHSTMESDFRSMLTQRSEASAELAYMLGGRDLNYADFTGGSDVSYICNGYENNDYIISITLERNGKRYVALQNYSTDDVNYYGISIPGRSSVIRVISA